MSERLEVGVVVDLASAAHEMRHALEMGVTRKWLLHSTSRSERCARGFTGRVRRHNANSKRQKWTFLRSRQQELI
jgi:hypothetical protein